MKKLDTAKTKEMLKIAIPAILEGLFNAFVMSVDAKMIACLGPGAISAVSLTSQPKMMFFSIFFALGTTVSIFVAQAFGKKDEEEASACLRIVLRVVIILSISLGVLLAIFAYQVMYVCNLQADTLDMSVVFFRIVMGGMVFFAVSVTVNGALRGLGRTGATLVSNVAMGLVDILFNYLLIEGHLGFPRLEIAGDALATVISTVVACAISLYFVIRKSDFLSLRGLFQKERQPRRSLALDIRNKSVNIVLENLLLRIGFLLSSIIVSMIPSAETAVYSVGMILLNYSAAFGEGLGNATVALVGKAKGGDDLPAVKKYRRVSIFLSIASAFLFSLVFVSISQLFFGQYFTEEWEIAAGVGETWIVAAISFFQTLKFVSVGCMRGLGDVKTPRRIATVCILLLNPSTGLLFAVALGMGMWGIWFSSFISQLAWMLLSIIWCRKDIANAHLSEKGE